MSKIIYNGVEYRSEEEVNFQMWCDEIIDVGILKSAKYEPKKFTLVEGQKVNGKLLHKKLTYCPDWELVFAYDSEGLLIDRIFPEHGLFIQTEVLKFIDDEYLKYFTYVDVKGIGHSGGNTKNSSAFTFPIKQAWVYEKYNIYVNKVIGQNTMVRETIKTPGFFHKTFVPRGCAFCKGRKVLTLKKKFRGCKLLSQIVQK